MGTFGVTVFLRGYMVLSSVNVEMFAYSCVPQWVHDLLAPPQSRFVCFHFCAISGNAVNVLSIDMCLYPRPSISVGRIPRGRISKSQVRSMFKLETDTGGSFMSSLRISKYSSA